MRQRTNRCRCDLKHGGSNLYDTARRMLVTLTIGDFFGEATVLEQLDGREGLATATVECASFVELLTLTRASLERVLKHHQHDTVPIADLHRLTGRAAPVPDPAG